MKTWKQLPPPWFSSLAALVLAGCGDSDFLTLPPLPTTPPSGEGTQKSTTPQPTLPARWTLTDVEGRTLQATIIGRNADTITIVREQDGKRFDLPVARLAEADRRRVATLPVRPAPPKSPMESSLYRMRRAKLDELQARIDEVNRLISTTNSDIQWRSYNSELRRLYQEESKLHEELRKLEGY